ncbi:site-specific DNA-methyltransferase [Cryobacterium sp. 10S3]|uniref:DNA-methyltransferase n=1 Tax=Cryobacterium sp. 10S3 TaxID=3048582 RepID=UPI002AC98DB6|nr:site-specific DNA-methyltransferase [Cryobacterium sp. 10S3]MEB0286185.1 site-specific DNA-methyltransferase [Cryobacterium sp. 10S3]WPX12243.1 site-specific DNA-methyltransferase [Cryobacterium sp. 10S3]
MTEDTTELPRPYFADELVTLHHGSCETVVAGFATGSIDAIVTDPPYEIGLMGKAWDSSGIAYSVDWWRECYRVLKPGGHLLSFGAARTVHRIASAIEDAGFEIRDGIMWIYGTGFPKNRDVSEAMTKYLAGEGVPGVVANINPNVYAVTGFLKAARDAAGWSNRRIDDLFGTNGMAGHWTSQASQPAIPSVRQWGELKAVLGFGDEMDATVAELASTERPDDWGTRESIGTFLGSLGQTSGPAGAWGTALKPSYEPVIVARKPFAGSATNNVIAYGTGALNLGANRVGGPDGRWPTNVLLDESQAAEVEQQSRGGSVVFPVFRYVAKPGSIERPNVDGMTHQTVKPLELMRWLVRLVTPPHGVVLDPFAGSGTTLEAALIEGFTAIGVELEADHLPLIRQRLAKPLQQTMFGDWEQDAA